MNRNSPPDGGKQGGLLKILHYAGGFKLPALGIVVGFCGGLGAVAFRYLIGFFQTLIFSHNGDLVPIVHTLPWWRVVLGPFIGGAFVGPIVYFFAKEAKGHGVPEVMEAVVTQGGVIRSRVAIVKILASAVCIGSGGSVGREGPIVQIGSTVGSSLGQLLRLPDNHLRVLVACGAAAGIAATFNAPMAGAIFALEIILADFAVPTFTPIILSSVVAVAVSRHFLGNYPAFRVPAYDWMSPWELGFYGVLGLLAGLVAVCFTISLYKSEDIWDAWKVPDYVKAALGGAVVGAIALNFPQVLGVGYDSIGKALLNQDVWSVVLLLIPLKIVATSITIGSGGSGGILAPSLFMGAMLGEAFGLWVHFLCPEFTAPPGAYAIVGMGAVVAGATHAPIQAFLIIFEMTQDYRIIPPLMICCVIATFVARGIKRDSIYTLKLMRRGVDIQAGRDVNLLKSMRVEDFMTRHPETVSGKTTLE